MVKILVKGNLVDLEAPIYMEEEKQNQFLKGMQEIFEENVVKEDIVENKKIIPKRTGKSKKFNLKDMIILANGRLEQEQIASKLDKSSFAIQMKRGPFLMQLMAWAKKKDLSKLNENNVQEFLKEIGYEN
jgi:hypothetical protein